jgi:hypothetical protein
LQCAEKCAEHLVKRHAQLRRARENRESIAEKLFDKTGKLRGVCFVRRKRSDRSSEIIEIVAQKVIDGKQVKSH